MSHTNYEVDDAVAILTLNNQPANLFTREMGEEIAAAFERAPGDGVRAMVIRSEGGVFCGGADINLFVDRTEEEARELMEELMPILQAIEDAPFPVIAAVHGLCLAAGLELSLSCDLIMASQTAHFSQVEALIGATTFGGGVYRLAERCGPARAAEICFTAHFYTAEQFERWNIVNRVVPDEELQEKALKWARKLAKGPTAAHSATKKLLHHATANGTRSADAYMAEIAPALFTGHDMPMAVRFMLEQGAVKFRENHDQLEFTGS